MTPEATPDAGKVDPRALIMRRGLDVFQAGLDEVTNMKLVEIRETYRLSKGVVVGNA